MAKLKTKVREQIIRALVGNCGCDDVPLFTQDDIPLLVNSDDDRLIQLNTYRERMVANAAIADAAKEGFEHDGTQIVFNEEEGGFVANDMPAFFKKKKDEEDDDEEECDNEGSDMNEAEKYYDNSGGGMAANPNRQQTGNARRGQRQPAKAPTLNEWLKNAPPEVKSVVANAVMLEKTQKTAFIKAITANEGNEWTKDELAKMDVGMLRKIAKGFTANSASKEDGIIANYLGAAAPANNGRRAASDFDEDDILPMPTINYEELASPALVKGKKKAGLGG